MGVIVERIENEVKKKSMKIYKLSLA